MKKVFLIFLLILSNLCLAETYYFNATLEQYNDLKKVLPSSLQIHKVFTKSEEQILKQLDIKIKPLYKIETNKTLDFLQSLSQTVIFSSSPPVSFNDYKDFQWALNNPGGRVERWISDIDVREIQAQKGEDLQLFEDKKEQRKTISVAVIDSGVDLTHPDLIDQIQKTPQECEALETYNQCLKENSQQVCLDSLSSLDADANGYPLDCHGWSFQGLDLTQHQSGHPLIKDNIGHGTHIAGIIAAKNNTFGIEGIAEKIKIVPIQVANNSHQDSALESIAKGLLYAIKKEVDIINISLGWRFQFDTLLIRKIIAAAIKKDILIVVAGGNSSHSAPTYPCSYKDVICVGAHDETGDLASFSNFGPQIDILAPGTHILSTWPTQLRSKNFTQDNNYEFMSGTSQAAPMVTGVLARLLSKGLSPQEAKAMILLGARKNQYNTQHSFGNLDYLAAHQFTSLQLFYPYVKTQKIINLDNNSPEIVLEFKNLGDTLKKAKVILHSNSQIKVIESTKTLFDIKTQQIKKINFKIKINEVNNLSSNQKLKLSIYSENNKRDYRVSLKLTNFLTTQSQHKKLTHYKIQEALNPNYTLKTFKNHSSAPKTIDFIAFNKDKNITKIKILQQSLNNTYVTSKTYTIKKTNPTFINFSKIDFDKDGQSEYVITYVSINSVGEKITHFFILGADLKPKKVFLAPDNKFNNEKVFMPGKFQWLQINKRYYPAWIGYGENPSSIPNSPWSSPDLSLQYFLYYLTPAGLKTINDFTDQYPIHLLPQNPNDEEQGNTFLITAKGKGFFKTYYLYRIEKTLKLLKEISFKDYFNLEESRPLALHKKMGAYFTGQSILGGKRVFTLEIDQTNNLHGQQVLIKNQISQQNLVYIPQVSQNYILLQTENHLGVFNTKTGQTQFSESQVDVKRRRYVALTQKEGLYLAQNQATGLSSLIYTINTQGELFLNAASQILPLQGCSEISLIELHNEDMIALSCLEQQQILFWKIFD
ncbi:MAG: S8 family serine peptidase [Bacteriovoracaceae bacterium]|jgi:subtilisin family serine protease|nr:S8 family serine peptidase [Bacteriovoracaceae bacterium]